jgi:hypothetical protein
MMVAITDGKMSIANFEANFSMPTTPARVLMPEL